MNEVRATEKLKQKGPHKNLVHIFGHNSMPRSFNYYIDMELCNGDLDNWIRTNHVGSYYELPRSQYIGTLEEIADILIDIVRGVNFIHCHGEVHRDLKPQNSMPP
jgi:serine/threonine protein kinase